MNDSRSNISNWESQLAATLPLFGHRNWIVVADAAYPAQSRQGIETIVAAADQIDVLSTVLGAIQGSRHIRANVYLDHELKFVAEQNAPGVSSYRSGLQALLAGATATPLPHEQIIAKLDQAAQMFRILIVKTNLTIPYTSVFFELDCGYWNAEAEKQLRAVIQAAQQTE